MKFTYNVIQTVEVDIDEVEITEEYLSEFSNYMWFVDEIEDIAKHIARNKALFDGYPVEFVPDEWFTAKVIDEDVEEA